MKPRRIVLSGCSGGGKSTLLQEMSERGYATVSEPGRRVIALERHNNGQAFPWSDPKAFCFRVIETALADFHNAQQDQVIFDRSALDALIWFDRTGTPLAADIRRAILDVGYDRHVYLTPSWPEIFEQDQDRQHDFEQALAEYQALCDRLPEYGFVPVVVPKMAVILRANWLEEQLSKG
ncbi:AAA family ATPase [Ruegeria arenilitoris]|uniref:AAA family ATPase n=1 Tax=Ruegeria arenilitoris TaxID=1173585 RepID=UPI00147F9421